MGQFFFAQKSEPLPKRLRLALFNKEKDKVDALLADPSLCVQELPVEIYVELVQRQWDWNVMSALCAGATSDNLVALLSSAVVGGATIPFKALFGLLKTAAVREGKNLQEIIESRLLKHLFIVVCHKNNDEMLDAFLENGCYDPEDTRPIRFFVHRELRKNSTATDKQIRRILSSHENQKEAVEALLEQYAASGPTSAAKYEASRTLVVASLNEYLSSGVDSGHLFGSPSYQRTVRAVVHSMKTGEGLSEDSLKSVAGFLPKK